MQFILKELLYESPHVTEFSTQKYQCFSRLMFRPCTRSPTEIISDALNFFLDKKLVTKHFFS